MEAYYSARAPEYDKLYELPAWQSELAGLRAWVAVNMRGRVVLEVAAGTGYWTEAAASTAKAIVATDSSPAMLAMAVNRRLGPHVTLFPADAYALPEATEDFDAGMAHLWWSHVVTQKQDRFLRHFASRLKPRAILLMIDQTAPKGFAHPILRRDRCGNRYELRVLENGTRHQVVKNYPSDAELRASISSVCDEIEINRLRYFWSLRARIRASVAKHRGRHHSGAL